jgi:hypothetical protein
MGLEGEPNNPLPYKISTLQNVEMIHRTSDLEGSFGMMMMMMVMI